jgi:RND superfamily putative drug exporter
LSGPLGFRETGYLDRNNLLLLLFLVLGLSTDYGVFLLARIKEAHDTGLDNREAVARGIERTGRIVTAAALLFCVAVGASAGSTILVVKEFAIGAALAVLIDATVVRVLLVPALMALLGEANWWAPRFLARRLETARVPART